MRGKVLGRLGFYEPQTQPRTANVSFRCPKALKESVTKLAGFWTEIEKARIGDPEAKVTEADVWIRIVDVAIRDAWAEVGGAQPKDATEMKQLVAKAVRNWSADPKK